MAGATPGNGGQPQPSSLDESLANYGWGTMSPPTRSIFDQLGLSAMLADDEEMEVSEEEVSYVLIDPANQVERVAPPEEHTDEVDQRLEDMVLEEGDQLLLGPRVGPTVPPTWPDGPWLGSHRQSRWLGLLPLQVPCAAGGA